MFTEFYKNLEHYTTISDIYEHLNKRIKRDLEFHSEKEYLKKVLEDYCFVVDVYDNASPEFEEDTDFHDFSNEYNDPNDYRNMLLSFIALEQGEYKRSYELSNHRDWKFTLATSIGYGMIKEYERILFEDD